MYYAQNRFLQAMEQYHSNRPRSIELLKDYYQGLMSLRQGDTIGFGHHMLTQDGKPICGDIIKRRITWDILDRQDDKFLLLSEYILDWDFFDEDGEAWENSYIRKLMNEEFCDAWFTDYEKKLLSPNPDLVFLLSLGEARKYFGDQNRGRAIMLYSEFEEQEDESLGEDVNIALLLEQENNWWLRTPGENGQAYVRWDGYIDEEGYNPGADEFGIRPAIWLDLHKLKALFEG